jgi:carbonic anhydrase
MESARLNRAALLGGAAAWAVALGLPADAAAPAGATVSAGDALERLEEGNERFVSGRLKNVSNIEERRVALAGGQSPYATILACSDSRTPPELIFDANVGELFVVRIAGNYVTDDSLGTIEYGFGNLGSNLLLVMGHASCGAVQATYDSIKTGKALPPHLNALATAIGPGIESIVRQGGSLNAAIKANVRAQVAAALSHSPVLKKGVASRTLRIVGATYNLEKGKVTIL